MKKDLDKELIDDIVQASQDIELSGKINALIALYEEQKKSMKNLTKKINSSSKSGINEIFQNTIKIK